MREGGLLNDDSYAALKSELLKDLADIEICDLTPAIVQRSVACLERHSFCALDAIHLGSALVYQPDLFVSADGPQLRAARSEGLEVEIPSDKA